MHSESTKEEIPNYFRNSIEYLPLLMYILQYVPYRHLTASNGLVVGIASKALLISNGHRFSLYFQLS
jgi:hypothetical protein